ncbi:MAG TPA: V-type ATP synthase subunit B [Myxococcales bacterium]|nr:V-type ATP synthase subunit B [Myxococcales bacterium]
MLGIEVQGLTALRGPLAFLAGVPGIALNEEVELRGGDGISRAGRVLAVSEGEAVLELFGSPAGLSLGNCSVQFRGRPIQIGVGKEMLGRVFDGSGNPRDGLPRPAFDERRPVHGAPINPSRRAVPSEFLETGISAIDALNTLVLGQKLPLFSEAGLPHDALLRQVVRQAHAPGVESFAVVFAGLGLPRTVAEEYVEDFRATGALQRTVAFLNLADDPAAERLMTPRCALTAAEFLAWDLGLHVLVVLHDITAYGEALREVAAARGEAPSRKGYPGYLYTDLASLFERAGRIEGRPGSITQLPVVTLPSGDLTHPIPDLTGYVTEGQVVLDRELHRRGVYPPVSVLPSLSRLMDDGIGPGRTRDDHGPLARQLYASLAHAVRSRALESIIGFDELPDLERSYLEFARAFEERLVGQRPDEARSIGLTLDIAWELLAMLPDSELRRIPRELLPRVRRGGRA